MVVGIVAEYNPFHNGHKLQIEYAKNVLGADQVIVAMSGSFTQRGLIACFDKYTRARAALMSGADIVLEIPSIFATASAREFASAGVSLLAKTRVCTHLLFSGESADKSLFLDSAQKIIDIEESGQADSEIQKHMTCGLNYATARAKFLEKYIPGHIISSPNNILGMEYTRFILSQGLPMDIEVMKRQNNHYGDKKLTGNISSATAIREHYESSGVFEGIPENLLDLYNTSTYLSPDDISTMLHYKLLSERDFARYLDCNQDLSDRILKNLKDYQSFSQFTDLLKSKNTNHSRISRVLCHILLGIRQDDFENAKAKGYINEIRMLGFSKNASGLLSEMKQKGVSLATAPTESTDRFDILSSDIVRALITEKTGQSYPNEYTRKFDLAGI